MLIGQFPKDVDSSGTPRLALPASSDVRVARALANCSRLNVAQLVFLVDVFHSDLVHRLRMSFNKHI